MKEYGTVLKPDEAALVVDENGDLQVCLPEYGDDETVPLSVMVMTAFWIKMGENEEWAQDLVEEVFGAP